MVSEVGKRSITKEEKMMRITKCKEAELQGTHLTLKWGEGEKPRIEGCECVDIGMSNALAFPKTNLGSMMMNNPDCKNWVK